MMQLKLVNHGPLNLKVPFWCLRVSVMPSYMLVLSPMITEGSIPNTGQLVRPWCFLECKAWMIMKTMDAIMISMIWICWKRKRMLENKFSVAATMLEVQHENVRLKLKVLVLVMKMEWSIDHRECWNAWIEYVVLYWSVFCVSIFWFDLVSWKINVCGYFWND